MSRSDQDRGATRRTLLKASAATGAGLAIGGMTPFQRLAYGATTSTDASAPFTPSDIYFNAHHSPIGAYATFTLGYAGASGGFGQQQKLPASQSTYIGVQSGGAITALPFFNTAASPGVTGYAQSAVSRDFRVASDTFSTSDFNFSLFSPVRSIPDPTGEQMPLSFLKQGPLTGISTAGSYPIEDVLLPAIFAQMVIDNSGGTDEKVAFFAVGGGNAAVLQSAQAGITFGTGLSQTAIVTDYAGAIPFTAQSLAQAMAGATGPGAIGGIAVAVPAGQTVTINFALCFFSGGPITTGRVTSFWYTQYYPTLASVIAAATTGLAARVASFAKDNLLVDNAGISNDQKFLLSQAIHSYYGNTAFMQDTNGAPWWVVLEGQYQYMNTFDLSVDQQFFEIGMNPWTTRNVLENSLNSYSYQTGTELPGGAIGAGGIAFTHDMGQWPAFSPNGTSAYEKPNVFGTFSYQTHEELTNWLLIAGVYIAQTNDLVFYENNVSTFEAILTSLQNRDNVVASQRDGISSYNASVVGTGEEITTYDSVGPGLTEAVGNTYLGGKDWAAYVILEGLLLGAGRLDLSVQAFKSASLAANTITKAMTSAGYIASNVYNGESIPIIPVVEGLVYPYFADRKDAVSPYGLYGNYIKALNTHLNTVLSTQYCIFPNGGWNLDSQSLMQNTWLSKIFLNEFVGRQVLGQSIRPVTNAADAQSVVWLTQTVGARDAFGDQVINQVPNGSLYYPRGVTSIVWLQEPRIS
jgi:hypothetical protein